MKKKDVDVHSNLAIDQAEVALREIKKIEGPDRVRAGRTYIGHVLMEKQRLTEDKLWKAAQDIHDKLADLIGEDTIQRILNGQE